MRKRKADKVEEFLVAHHEEMEAIGATMGSEWAKDLWDGGNGTPQGFIKAVDARLTKIENDVHSLKGNKPWFDD